MNIIGGILEGYGRLGATNTQVINQGGTVIPGDPINIGTLTLNGGYTQQANGTLLIKALDTLNFDHLNNVGNFPMTLDGTLEFQALPGATINLGDEFQILQSNQGINGTFSQIKSNLPANLSATYETRFNIQGFVVIGGCVIPPCPTPLTFAPSMRDYVSFSTAQFSRTTMWLHQIGDRARAVHGRMAPSYLAKKNAVANTSDKKILSKNAKPDLLIASNTTMIAGQTKTNQPTKQQQVDVGFFEKNQSNQPMSVYIAPIGSFGDADRVKKENGFDFWTAGVIAGADYSFNRAGIGMQLIYEKLDADVHHHWVKFDINTAAAEFYGTFLPFGTRQFFLDLATGAASNWYNIHRHINGETAKGKPQGWEWNAYGAIGYDLWWEKIRFTPLAGVQYIDLRIEDYKEHGAGDLDVRVRHQRFHSFRSQFGVSIGGRFVQKSVTWLPEVRGYWLREYANQKHHLGVTSVGFDTRRQINLAGGERNYGVVGTELRALFAKHWNVAGSHDFYTNGDIFSNSFYGEIGANF